MPEGHGNPSVTGTATQSHSRETPILETRGLCFEAGGKRLLDRIDLTIQARRRTVILGSNGAGKSLLLRLLHGLLQPATGQVLWHGRPLDAEARREQAMVFQRPVMLRRSVRANLRFALAARGLRHRERIQREAFALDIAQLGDKAKRPARTLSVGEQQRLAVARALACRPEILFLDEPMSSLDPASTLAVEQLIMDASKSGVTIVIVTHDVGQARRLGQDALFMHGGRIVETRPLKTLIEAPESEPARYWLEGRLFPDGIDAANPERQEEVPL